MPTPTRDDEGRGTRHLMFWGAIVAAVLLVGTSLWAFLPSPEIGSPGVDPRQTAATGVRTNQGAGESAAGRSATNADPAGDQARDILETGSELTLTDEQLEQLRSVFSANQVHRVDEVNFSLLIGSAVPREIELQPLPSEVPTIMGGYEGDDYILVRDQLVIVDGQARRVVAIVPGIT